MSATLLIGVDGAVNPKNVGLACGHLDDGKLVITHAEPGDESPEPSDKRRKNWTMCDIENTVVKWFAGAENCLLAIDAPLGWPRPFGETIVLHKAGTPIPKLRVDCVFDGEKQADQMFMRDTDRRIYNDIRKKPLAVGANSIARIALAALSFLEALRNKTGRAIPLAWIPGLGVVKETSAIEVYPAATVKCHGFSDKGYQENEKVWAYLEKKMVLHKDIKERMRKNKHVFDAVLCVLAAADFIGGEVRCPANRKLAEKEGWIWVKTTLPKTVNAVNINDVPNNRSPDMLKGSIVALITPMDDAGGVDFDSLRRLVDFHLQNGTDGIVSVGTSGESATLDIDEQIEVIRRTVEFAAGRVPVIAGSGANSTAEALELTSRAAALGVRACLLVVPYYNKPTQHGLYRHFRAIAEAVDVPQILYNVPGRTALDMANDTVARLAQIPNIIGIKDASADISRVGDFLARCGEDFAVYSGDDATTLELMKAGGHGCISVTANVAPKLMHTMCAAALGGDFAEATRINESLNDLHTALFAESNPIPVKWAVAELGLAPRGIRLPLTWLSEEYHGTVTAAMRRAGVLN